MYLTNSDILIALAPSTVMAIFDDNNDGVLDQASIDAFNTRASAQVDSWIAPVYAGPFPITQSPVPGMIRELALGFFTFFMYERHPEYTRTLGESQVDRWKRLDALAQRLQSAVQRIPDLTAQPKPSNVGGVIVDDAKRVMTTGPDGIYTGGDF